jgi:hypothetical protein
MRMLCCGHSEVMVVRLRSHAMRMHGSGSRSQQPYVAGGFASGREPISCVSARAWGMHDASTAVRM